MTTQMNKRTHHAWKNSRYTLCVLLLLAAIAVAGIWGTQSLLLENARIMGEDLVHSYVVDEEHNVEIYKTMITLGMSYLDDLAAAGASEDEVRHWLMDFFDKSVSAIPDAYVSCYAVVDGQIIASQPFDGMESYDYKASHWYELAFGARGNAVLTGAYQSAADQKRVVSIAMASAQNDNALIMDLYPEKFIDHNSTLTLVEGRAYYLCDSRGDLLYHDAPFNADGETMEAYVEDLYSKIQEGNLKAGDVITDLNGSRRGIYYFRSGDGWMSILTLPYTTLLQGLYGISVLYAVILVMFLIVSAFLWLKDRRIGRDMERTNDTIRVLGNSYYALYRIDMERGIYEMTKGSDFVRERLPYKGNYEDLVNVLVTAMDEDTGSDFKEGFSLENIRRLNRSRTGEFGGDFLRTFGGTYRWINVRLLMDASLGRGEAVLCFRFVDQEKQRQLDHIRLLEDALSAADSSEKARMRFFSGMSHDMRTPLNVIIGMAELALRPDCSEQKIHDYLENIHVSSKQLLALINDILEMSRLEQGHITLETKTFNISDTLSACAQPFMVQAKTEHKTFNISIQTENPVVCGDSIRLTQILNNLISNAIKFTNAGDVITVTLCQSGTGRNMNYVFTVTDTGIGMSAEFLPRIFEPYEREKRFGVREVMGTGLGMPIVKNLIVQMGGDITVESSPGKGSRFVVTLPFSPGVMAASEPETVFCGDILKGKHVLLAEDNALNMEIAVELLKSFGLQVTTAENGRIVLDIFQNSPPGTFDAILMDMQMPEMDGCTAAREIRALHRPDAVQVPIIALTANAFSEDIARTQSAGMNAHLSKPIDATLLGATLEKLLAKAPFHCDSE